jgi:uncharacterized membrane protein YeaQ/YmgE (transglycosylase-associated protein family)
MVPLPVAINLSYWLYKVHPPVFAALLNHAKGRPSGLGSLGDDGSDFLPGVSVMPDNASSFDVGNFIDSGSGASVTTSDISSSISPDLVSLPQPQETIGSGEFYTGITPMPAADTTADIGNFLANSDAAPAGGSAPSTLNPPTASNVGAVAGVITAGLGALAAVTTAIYKAGTPQASTIATQANRAAAGINPAPITYAYNSAGQLVPLLASMSTGTVGALSPQTLATLGIPSTWGPYVVPALVGILVVMAIGAMKK